MEPSEIGALALNIVLALVFVYLGIKKFIKFQKGNKYSLQLAFFFLFMTLGIICNILYSSVSVNDSLYYEIVARIQLFLFDTSLFFPMFFLVIIIRSYAVLTPTRQLISTIFALVFFTGLLWLGDVSIGPNHELSYDDLLTVYLTVITAMTSILTIICSLHLFKNLTEKELKKRLGYFLIGVFFAHLTVYLDVMKAYGLIPPMIQVILTVVSTVPIMVFIYRGIGMEK